MILTVTPNPCLHKIVTFRGNIDERTVLRPVESRFLAGGKGVNAARAARTFGAEVLALLTCGGPTGALLVEGLGAEGIACDAVEVRRSTRMSTLIHGADDGWCREFLEEGDGLERGDDRRFRTRFAALMPDADWVTLNGSVPCPSMDEFHAWAVVEGKRAGKRVLLDTYGRAAVLAVEKGPYMAKANLDEVRGSFAVSVDKAEGKRRFASGLFHHGVEHVLLTDGERGAWLFTGDEEIRFWISGIQEVNAVGSGDAMLGAVAALLDRGADLVEAVRAGVAAGAANAARPGVCDFPRGEPEALLAAVAVERVTHKTR